MSTGTICGKLIFWRLFCISFGFARTFLGHPAAEKVEELSKQHYLCQMEHCEENLFLEHFIIFHRFLTMCRIILKFWQVFFVTFVKTAFYVSTGTVSAKIVSWKTFQPNLDVERNFLAKDVEQVVKTAFQLSKWIFQKNVLFSSVSTFGCILSGHLTKNFGGVVKKVF